MEVPLKKLHKILRRGLIMADSASSWVMLLVRMVDKNIISIHQDPGKNVELKVGGVAQLDVKVQFIIKEKSLELANKEDVDYECKIVVVQHSEDCLDRLDCICL